MSFREEESLDARAVEVVECVLLHGPARPAEHVKLSRVEMGSGINASNDDASSRGNLTVDQRRHAYELGRRC